MILSFLGASPDTACSRKEIARKAVKRAVYEEDPRWIDVPLAALLARGLVEQDKNGLLKLKRAVIP